jgi:2-polyprenyl-6-methoxyphenol hydroxylase-like FAD-dependent oxidoreductase
MTAALRDAALLAQAVIATNPGRPERRAALAHYQDVRDRLSAPMVVATDEIAGYDWDLDRIRVLLRNLASAMTDEVELLAGLATGPSERLRR